MTTISNPISSLLDSTGNSDPSTLETSNIDKRFAEMLADEQDAKDTLAELTKNGMKGYWSWKMKEMRKQIADKVVSEMNLTPEKIAAMDAKTRVETEQKILDIVEQRLKLAINEEMKRQQRNTLAANASLQSMVSAQDIMNT